MSETPKKKVSPWFVFAVVTLLTVLAVEGVMISRPGKPQLTNQADKAERDKAIAEGPNQTETFGEESAPVKIEFYAPLALEWHQKTIGLLREYDQQRPGRIYVELMPMGNAECDQEMLGRGFGCAVIFIDGEHEFTLPEGRKVDLQKKPNAEGSFYNSEDVVTVLENLK